MELYHEIIKQDIFEIDVGFTKFALISINILQPMNFHGKDFLLLNIFNQKEFLSQIDF